MMLFHRFSEDYVYAEIKNQDLQKNLEALFLFHEKESTTCVLTLQEAQAKKINYTYECNVFKLAESTSLTAVGITAKIASVLARKQIPCNVVAGLHHDYFLVPKHRAEEAFDLLKELN